MHNGGPTSVSATGVLTGMCSSFAVMMFVPSSYVNCHHHWRALTVTCSTPGPLGCFASEKMSVMVNTAMTARISAGMTVQLISSAVWPCVCTGRRSSPGFTRNRNAT